MHTAAAELTYTGIFLAVFAEQLCLPVPAALALLSAGALMASGEHRLHLFPLLAGSVLASLAADSLWFWLGRRWGSRVIRLICSFTGDPRRSRERARDVFARWGMRLLVVAKFLPGLNGVAPPLAGAEGTTVASFALFDSLGALLWIVAYVGLGFLFSHQIGPVLAILGQLGRAVLSLAAVPLLVWAAWRGWQILRVLRHLRLHRITPEALHARIERNEPVAILDLLNFDARMGSIPGIPGALRVDPQRLKVARFKVPPDIDVVLYCTSRNELASARVAEALEKRLGVTDVWVLEGGLDAWVEQGLPVTAELSTREQLAERFGLIMPTD